MSRKQCQLVTNSDVDLKDQSSVSRDTKQRYLLDVRSLRFAGNLPPKGLIREDKEKLWLVTILLLAFEKGLEKDSSRELNEEILRALDTRIL